LITILTGDAKYVLEPVSLSLSYGQNRIVK